MIKKIVFDMDGTLVDLYSVPHWAELLDHKNPLPYEIAKPLYNMDELNSILLELKKLGYIIAITTWLTRDANEELKKKVRNIKKSWLKKYNVPIDEFHGVQYGTPKHTVTKADIHILVDDSLEVRSEWKGKTIDARNNIIPELKKIIQEEIVNYI